MSIHTVTMAQCEFCFALTHMQAGERGEDLDVLRTGTGNFQLTGEPLFHFNGMLLSPEWCYSDTNSKDHFHEKISNAVFHPTLPTPFKGEGEQRIKYNGRGSACYGQGCDFSGSTEKPIDCIHHDYLPCCIHGCLMVGGRTSPAFPLPFQSL